MTMKLANLHGLSVSSLHTRSHLWCILLIASPLLLILSPHARLLKAKQASVKERCTSVSLHYNTYIILIILTCIDTATRQPVQQAVLQAWRPSIKTGKSIDVNSENDSEQDNSESTISEHTQMSPSSRSAIMAKSEDKVEQDIISISSGIWPMLDIELDSWIVHFIRWGATCQSGQPSNSSAHREN